MDLTKIEMTGEEKKQARQKGLELQRRLPEIMELDPKVPFRFMGKDLSLEMNNLALMGILKDTGINILGDGFKTTQLDNPEVAGSVLFWALSQNHSEITRAEVDKNINARHFMYIRERIMESLSYFMPKEDETPKPIDEGKKTDNPPV